MAMTMNGQVQLSASREVVWAKLNDPEVLKGCIPGSEQFEKVSDNEFQAVATVKVAAILPWDPHSNKSTLNLRRTTGQGSPFHFGCVTAAANLTKKSSAVFFAALLLRR